MEDLGEGLTNQNDLGPISYSLARLWCTVHTGIKLSFEARRLPHRSAPKGQAPRNDGARDFGLEVHSNAAAGKVFFHLFYSVISKVCD